MTLVRRNFLRLACGAIAGSVVAPDVRAQSYPARPIRVVVSVAAGGTNDVTARMIAQKLTEAWGQQVFVDNVPGGGEIVGTGQVAKAEPNGYTALFATGAFTLNPSLHSKLPYDTLKDFTPVTLVASGPHVLTVHPSVPAKDVNELVALVRANPGKYSYASPGTGTTGQLAGELFRLSLKLDIVHVPFNGGAPAAMSTVGGHTPIMFSALPSTATFIRDGSLRALAVTSGKRDPSFPDVPTLAEAGVPDQESEFIQAVLVPTGTPRDIVDKLYREIARVVALPEVKERLAAIGYTPVANTRDEFSAQIKRDVARWAKVIHDAGIKQIE